MEKKGVGRGLMIQRILEHASLSKEERKDRAAATLKKPFRSKLQVDDSDSSSGHRSTPDSSFGTRSTPDSLSSSSSSLAEQKSTSGSSSGFVSSDKDLITPAVGKGRAKYIRRDDDVDVHLGKLKISKGPQRMEVPDDAEETVIRTGHSGDKVNVVTNYLRLDVEPGRGVFQYDVSYSPEVDSRFMRIKLLKSVNDIVGDITMFDGHILYLPFHLEKQEIKVVSEMPTDGSKVTIKIAFVKKLTNQDNAMIHLYNILFRKVMNKLGLVLHGQNYFDPNASKSVPLHKLELWPGWITAIHEYEGGIMLCCDASFRVLRTETVLDQMEDIQQDGGNNWKAIVEHAIVGQTVLTRYNNKIYRVDDIDYKSSPRDEFERSGTKMSYIDYYRSQYDITIKNRGQPLLQSRVKSKIKGEPDHMVNLVPELCFLSGLTDEIRSDVRIMKDVTSHTRISPAQREQMLKKFVRAIKEKPDVVQIFKDWGLNLSSDPLKLQARRLAPETIHFGNDISHRGTLNAEWNRQAASSKALSCVRFSNWVVFYTGRDRSSVEGFISMAIKCGTAMGIHMEQPRVVVIPNDATLHFIKGIQEEYNQNRMVQMFVVIFPNARNDKYQAVKRLCCIDAPVPTQVILARTISRVNNLRSVSQKIVMQMNCKLGGALWTVDTPLKESMVVGMDTYHDPTRHKQSVCAVVASLDRELSRWYSKAFQQYVGSELNDGLELCIIKCLTKYKEVNGFYPCQIILYRDGVGDGDITYCQQHEITQIKTAFNRISVNYNPKLLCVIAQKRIHTRIFGLERNMLENPSPGTILDHTVTRKTVYDFYLVSVLVKQGTVTPTHYVVVYNTTNLTPDQVQRFTFKMTHLYYNWCGTIRSPAPCQYAHKLAKLIGEHVHKDVSESLCDKLYFL